MPPIPPSPAAAASAGPAALLLGLLQPSSPSSPLGWATLGVAVVVAAAGAAWWWRLASHNKSGAAGTTRRDVLSRFKVRGWWCWWLVGWMGSEGSVDSTVCVGGTHQYTKINHRTTTASPSITTTHPHHPFNLSIIRWRAAGGSNPCAARRRRRQERAGMGSGGGSGVCVGYGGEMRWDVECEASIIRSTATQTKHHLRIYLQLPPLVH